MGMSSFSEKSGSKVPIFIISQGLVSQFCRTGKYEHLLTFLSDQTLAA